MPSRVCRGTMRRCSRTARHRTILPADRQRDRSCKYPVSRHHELHKYQPSIRPSKWDPRGFDETFLSGRGKPGNPGVVLHLGSRSAAFFGDGEQNETESRHDRKEHQRNQERPKGPEISSLHKGNIRLQKMPHSFGGRSSQLQEIRHPEQPRRSTTVCWTVRTERAPHEAVKGNKTLLMQE
jgi:hypothetical protein